MWLSQKGTIMENW